MAMNAPINCGPEVIEQISAATAKFIARFGRAPTHVAIAPGRVNLIGEHTDYHDGFVLPMAIDRYSVMLAALTKANQSTIWAVDLDAVFQADVRHPLHSKPDSPSNYVFG